jgi:hypothetical protein
LLFCLVLRLLGRDAGGVEKFYAEGPLSWLGILLSRASGLYPGSLAEIVVVAVIVFSVVTLGASLLRAPRDWAQILDRVLFLASCGAVAFLAFILLFGLDYERPRLGERLGWGEVRPGSLARAAALGVALANSSYQAAFGTEDLGSPSSSRLSAEELDKSIDAAYERVGRDLGLEENFRAARGRAKRLYLSPVLCWLGLSGFYFPWTGEANVNALVPPFEQVHAVAHEKAHQRGMAREDEANFLGALACLRSSDASVRYAGAFFAAHDLLRELARQRSPELRGLLRERTRGVVRDWEAEKAFWRRYEGFTATLSQKVNDTYLKSQGVREGTLSYEESARLLVLFFEKSQDF